jgi:hypothetical protein
MSNPKIGLLLDDRQTPQLKGGEWSFRVINWHAKPAGKSVIDWTQHQQSVNKVFPKSVSSPVNTFLQTMFAKLYSEYDTGSTHLFII